MRGEEGVVNGASGKMEFVIYVLYSGGVTRDVWLVHVKWEKKCGCD